MYLVTECEHQVLLSTLIRLYYIRLSSSLVWSVLSLPFCDAIGTTEHDET